MRDEFTGKPIPEAMRARSGVGAASAAARGIHRDAETRTVAIAGVVPNHLIETC